MALWDLRNLKMKLNTFTSHTDDILQVRCGACLTPILAQGCRPMSAAVGGRGWAS